MRAIKRRRSVSLGLEHVSSLSISDIGYSQGTPLNIPGFYSFQLPIGDLAKEVSMASLMCRSCLNEFDIETQENPTLGCYEVKRLLKPGSCTLLTERTRHVHSVVPVTLCFHVCTTDQFVARITSSLNHGNHPTPAHNMALRALVEPTGSPDKTGSSTMLEELTPGSMLSFSLGNMKGIDVGPISDKGSFRRL